MSHQQSDLTGLAVDDVGMRRVALIAALRDRSLWPEGFKWNFWQCETCGVGLFQQLMNVARRDGENTDSFMARQLGMSISQASNIFVTAWPYGVCHEKVTPKMVADKLEAVHRELTAAALSHAAQG